MGAVVRHVSLILARFETPHKSILHVGPRRLEIENECRREAGGKDRRNLVWRADGKSEKPMGGYCDARNVVALDSDKFHYNRISGTGLRKWVEITILFS
jgi:hypothetical protein